MRRRRLLLGAAAALACAPADPGHRGEVARILATARWSSARTAHVHLHALAGTPAAPRAAALARTAEAARTENLRLLGIEDSPGLLEVIVLPTREHLRPFTGGTPGGWALPGEGGLLVVADGAVGVPLRHETMHVLSWRRWGEPAGHWISEGVAMLPTPVCGGYPLDWLAGDLARRGALLPLAELPGRFSAASAEHHVQAASLVRYVHVRFGDAGLRRLWSAGMRGSGPALGVPLERLESEWRAGLQPPPQPIDWTRIGRLGCEPP